MNEYIDSEKLKKDISKLVEESLDKARGQIGITKAKVQEKREKAKDYIRDNPEKSVLMAAGAGAAVALLFLSLVSWKKCGRS